LIEIGYKEVSVLRKSATCIAVLVLVACISALAPVVCIGGAAHAVSGTEDAAARVDNPGIEPAASGYLALDGGRIFYEVFGKGFPLVFIHDGLAHSVVWDAQVADLAGDYRVVRYDRRGYGRSDKPEKAFSNVADLDTLVQFLKLERIILIGSSAGGGLAIDYTLAHPERVEGLVLVGAVVNGMGYSFHFMRRGYANYSLDAEENLENWINDQYSIVPGNDEARARLEEILRACPNDLDFSRERFSLEPPAPALERLSEIAVPALLVTGEKDIPDVHVHAGAIEAGIRGAHRVIIDGTGHLLYLERPDAFNAAVREFLDRLTVPKGAKEFSKRAEEPWSSFERGFIPVDGGALYYEAMGEGEPLVLLHGGMLDHRMWNDQFAPLAERFRVIRFDARGNGLARSPYGGHCDYEDLRVLMDSLGVERANVIGLSLGGRVAVDFALEHPERVLKVIAVSPGLSGYDFDSEEERHYLEEIRTAFIDADFDRAAETFFRWWSIGPHRQPEDMRPELRARILEWNRQALYMGMDGGYLVEADPPALGRLAEIHVPMLVIVGNQDMPGIIAIADMIEKQVPGARKIVIENAAHMAYLEKPAEFNEAALDFLLK
jgi:3-oxoadipate enol-lactonase